MARKMKDSGIEWIGEIPEGWEVTKLKYLATFPIEKNARTDSPYIGLENIESWTGKYVLSDSQYDKSQALTFSKNNILFGKLRPYLAKVFCASNDGCCSSEFCILNFSSSVNIRYFWNLLISPTFIDHVTKSTYGTKMPRANTDFIKNICAPVPPHIEQDRIALYLDAASAKIDFLLSKTRASVEEYKKLKQAVITQAVTKGVRGEREMKDSGVEWIGEIPTSYSICKLKYLLKNPLKYGANESGIPYSDSLPRYIRITDITPDGNLKCTGKLSLSEESAKDYILEDGDILFARSGATVGKTFIYYQSYGRSAYAGYLIKASLNNKVSPKFVYYYTCSSLYEIWKNSIFIQSTIQNIGADRYANLPVPVPKTLQEQEEIADYLDAKCAEIDGLIAKKEQLVKELESYKKSLIYEVVTGKREV